MHTTRCIFVLSYLLFGLISGCSHTPPTTGLDRSRLEGCWYGEDYQPAIQNRAGWLINRKADGTFSIEFRTVGSGSHIATRTETDGTISIEIRMVGSGSHIVIQTESGHWAYSDGKYRVITSVIDGKAVEPPHVDDYVLKSISDTQMTYYHVGKKITFTSKRVGCDFKDTPNGQNGGK